MLEISSQLANRLIKSDARHRIVDCSLSAKASIIFNLVNDEKNVIWSVIDGRKLHNGDWELFAMKDTNGELHDILLSEMSGYEIKKSDDEFVEVNSL